MKTSGLRIALWIAILNAFGAMPLIAQNPAWKKIIDPFHIAGPVYYVGTAGLGAWLFDTGEGLILMNSGMHGSGPVIESAIRKLNFKPEQIRIILACHAHFDHVGGLAYLQKISGAQLLVMQGDETVMESGGETDYLYGTYEPYHFDAMKVGRVLQDGEVIRLGKVSITALHTGGHTKGCTTFVTEVVENGRNYKVAFIDGTSVNPGVKVAKEPSYPGIYEDYLRTFAVLDSLQPDIWMSPHTERFDLNGKLKKSGKHGVESWVDPKGYRRFVTDQRKKFKAIIAKENN